MGGMAPGWEVDELEKCRCFPFHSEGLQPSKRELGIQTGGPQAAFLLQGQVSRA